MDRSIVAFAACAFFAVLVMSSGAAAEIYRWDDEDGIRHLTNDLNEVPAQYRDQALADDAGRKATNSRINIIDAEPAASNSGAAEGIVPRGAPAAAAAHPQNANPMPGGQSEMWWRQTALQLQRNVAAAENALESAQDRGGDDDSVTINRRGRGRGGSGRARGPGRRGRVGGGGSDSSDYTEYSYERDLDELEVAVADAERAYQDFHDQARRADVPKGWLRR